MAFESEEQRQERERGDLGMPWQGLEGVAREQAIRDHYLYAASETRTQAERDAAAARIVAKAEPSEVVTRVSEALRREEAARLRGRADFGNKMREPKENSR